MLKLEMMFLSMLLLPFMSPTFMWVVMSLMLLATIMWSGMTMNIYQLNMVSEYMAVDTMSYSLTTLTIWVTAMMILASTKIFISNSKPKLFSFSLITLMIILINCFTAPNMFMFYIWFEASLIPTMALIMLWGYQPERAQASMYLMMYTVTASLPMLLMFTKIYITSKTAMMPMFMNLVYPQDLPSMSLAWILTLGGFLVKLPMFLVHLWLPKAHVEAPISGSMILAAILLKLGGYGIMRMLSLFSYMSKTTSSIISSVALVGAITTSLICFRQSDLKSLIAYSSISHMGLMIAGAMTNTNWGFQAALAMMVAHGLSSSALFVMANINYELLNTRSLYLLKGIMTTTPILTMWWFLFTAVNMAAPPSINLLSEIMLISSILTMLPMSMFTLVLISFLSAAYSLYFYTSMNHGSNNLFSNPSNMLKLSNYTLLMMHLTPILLIMLKPEMITNWN